MRGMCSLQELRTIYTINDVMDMHEAIAESMLIEKHRNDLDKK